LCPTWKHPGRTHGYSKGGKSLLKLREGITKGHGRDRWELKAERKRERVFLFPGAFKTYHNLQKGKNP
jgi:hypothetical protein